MQGAVYLPIGLKLAENRWTEEERSELVEEKKWLWELLIILPELKTIWYFKFFLKYISEKRVGFYHGFIFLLQQPIGLYSIIYNDLSVAVKGWDLTW